jgi:protease I
MGLFSSTPNLKGKRIAILATEGVEQVELTKPRKALEKAGAVTHLISPSSHIKGGKIKAWNLTKWGDTFKVDVKLADANPAAYDALLLPGGVMNPDFLRMDNDAVRFVRAFVEAGKPMAAICHGPWMLIEAQAVAGRTITSWPSLKTDLTNAGAIWVDQEVAQDRGLVTSRNPGDIPAFNKAILNLFSTRSQSTSIAA